MSPSILASASSDKFVDLDVPVWAWVGLGLLLALLLTIDLVRHRDDHEPTPGGAARETIAWICCGLAFGGVIAIGFGSQAFGEYISGYLIEKSLSVDNVFVWAILFASLAIPLKYQHRVLFWGIFGALALRLVFILVGSALIARFFWLLIVFGVFLIYTGFKIIRHRANEGDDVKTTGLGLLKRFMPVTTEFDGHKFFTMQNAKRAATPLFAALVVIELTDVIFAVDSVPAVLAVSHEPYIVFASNAFAILGLRAMYFLLANAKEKFKYLSHALGGILVFVGIKMTISHWVHMNTYLSLAIIVTMLTVAIIMSLQYNKKNGIDSPKPPVSAAH